jgi:hypothetical protein
MDATPAALHDIINSHIHDEMNSNSNTTGLQLDGSWTPSIRSLNRRWSAISNAEEGDNAAAEEAQQAISEEIDEIKRYEVCRQFGVNLIYCAS